MVKVCSGDLPGAEAGCKTTVAGPWSCTFGFEFAASAQPRRVELELGGEWAGVRLRRLGSAGEVGGERVEGVGRGGWPERDAGGRWTGACGASD